PKWIESGLLRKWKLHCDKSHQRRGQRCHISPAARYPPPVKPEYLVDTWLGYITLAQTLAPADVDYVTLSYVWGPVQPYTTLKKNLHMLQTPGSLANPLVLSKLANTVKDAIALSALPKERYLWIDTFCIVQDDDNMRHRQINHMSSIFANSHLTIVAEDGDNANYGLRGLQGVSKPREFKQDLHRLTSQVKLLARSGSYDQPSVWSKRGWTFQEELFSPRKLRFYNQVARWECPHSFWSEYNWQSVSQGGTISSAIPGTDEPESIEVFSVPFASLSGYLKLLGRYNDRDLSYQKDSLFAFAGITTALSRVFPGGFISGIPQMFFDIALLWQPIGDAKRRTPNRTSGSKSLLPSWSWAGWQCKVDYRSCDPAFSYFKSSKFGEEAI
ncbi:HET-domain-containing protein, partial [Eremomyces bilateralis CBS 781.70]